MDAYWPTSTLLIPVIACMLLLILMVGLVLTRASVTWGRPGAWLLVLGGFGAAHGLCIDEPAGFRMLAIIGAVLFAMKAVVAVEAQQAGGPRLSWTQWYAWAGGWPGMKPSLFASLGASDPDEEAIQEARGFVERGLVRCAIGAALLVLARWVWALTASHIAVTVLALPGLSLCLHFGIFNLLAGFWRLWGVPTYSLFPAPLAARSLSTFWGRRWNLPFTEMIQLSIYRPLSERLGRQGAAGVGFVCSGLLHECAISVPVGEGFGWPLLYFAIHGALVVVERTTGLRDRLEEGSSAWAHLWTLGWLALPMPILFHPPFLRGVVWPLIGVPG